MKNKNEAMTKEFFLEYMEGFRSSLKKEIMEIVDIKIEYAIGELARIINRNFEDIEARLSRLEESLHSRT